MESFVELLSDTIDDTIRQVFGESGSELIYTLVETHVFLKREEVAEKIEAFYSYLERLLGLEGAQIIQNTSLKRFYFKLWREYEEVERYFSFLDELYDIKFKLLIPSFKEESSACNCN